MVAIYLWKYSSWSGNFFQDIYETVLFLVFGMFGCAAQCFEWLSRLPYGSDRMLRGSICTPETSKNGCPSLGCPQKKRNSIPERVLLEQSCGVDFGVAIYGMLLSQRVGMWCGAAVKINLWPRIPCGDHSCPRWAPHLTQLSKRPARSQEKRSKLSSPGDLWPLSLRLRSFMSTTNVYGLRLLWSSFSPRDPRTGRMELN